MDRKFLANCLEHLCQHFGVQKAGQAGVRSMAEGPPQKSGERLHPMFPPIFTMSFLFCLLLIYELSILRKFQSPPHPNHGRTSNLYQFSVVRKHGKQLSTFN